MKILNLLLLDKEARLFDTKEFIIKSFVAVVIGYTVGHMIPYISKDMISLLFGMMLTLEPVNMTGIRSGLKQVEATVIGALITGVILAIFGYSAWTAALTVSATLYVSLKIDWRNYSVVAMFTSIYMNTYVQTNAAGIPSEFETFKLRIAALMTGVLIAFLVNWIFSVFGYRHMLEKRVFHILDDLSQKMTSIGSMLETGKFEEAKDIMRSFPGLINNVDWIYGTALDLEKDPSVKRGEKKRIKIEKVMKITGLSREMIHLCYDLCYKVSKGDHHYGDPVYREDFNYSLEKLELIKYKLQLIIDNKQVVGEVAFKSDAGSESALNQINENIGHIDTLLTNYS